MRTYENKLIDSGVKFIAGTDEVGRGPLAGPLVTAAVILPNDFNHPGIKDSKKLNDKQINEMYQVIVSNAHAYSIIEVPIDIIDSLNVKAASRFGMAQCIEALNIEPDYVLVDFETLDIKIPQIGIIKGDAKSISIAAASILAKKHRDDLMKNLHIKFPEYDWHSNVGYGTKKHIEAIKKFGFTVHHRKSFNPYKSYLKNQGN